MNPRNLSATRVVVPCSQHRIISEMKVLLTLLLWSILLVLCWPLALVILVVWPLLWLLSIPFRIVVTLMEALLAFAKALLFLPARLLGYRSST